MNSKFIKYDAVDGSDALSIRIGGMNYLHYLENGMCFHNFFIVDNTTNTTGVRGKSSKPPLTVVH